MIGLRLAIKRVLKRKMSQKGARIGSHFLQVIPRYFASFSLPAGGEDYKMSVHVEGHIEKHIWGLLGLMKSIFKNIGNRLLFILNMDTRQISESSMINIKLFGWLKTYKHFILKKNLFLNNNLIL